MSLADLINLSIAVFTAAAAIAAWVSTTASLKATEQALNFAALPSGATLYQPNGLFNPVSGNGCDPLATPVSAREWPQA
jgi:hypothetical protein